MLLRALRTARDLGRAAARFPRAAGIALGASDERTAARPQRLVHAMAIVLPLAAGVAWVLPRLTLVMSPSIEAWILFEAAGPIGRGDLVSFDLSHRLAGPRPVRVTKYALCLPGERIEWIEMPSLVLAGAWDAAYYCEDRLLGTSKPMGRDGRRLEHWRPAYRIMPPGMIYVGSAHSSGFDSRYYGPVPIGRLTRMEKLL